MYLLAESTSHLETLVQHLLIGLTNGSLFALIAIGYTMVYGIIGLINFAHGDLFMLGSMLSLTMLNKFLANNPEPHAVVLGLAIFAILVVTSAACAAANVSVDLLVYKPLRNAPKLAPLVSAIGVSFIFMNLGLFWYGAADVNYPNAIKAMTESREPDTTRAGSSVASAGVSEVALQLPLARPSQIQFTAKDLMVICVTVPLMIALTLFVKFTRLGTAMRATEQSQTAAALMGINVDRVIAWTFAIGGALAGAASVVYGLYINTISFQMGFTNGLYAFTAAVLGGIGSIPGAVLGGLTIGLVKSLGSAYIGERWTSALVFVILIVILIFRPSGLLGTPAKEKV